MYWRQHPFGCFSGLYNMEFDRRMLADLQGGAVKVPQLRFYCWDLPTISLGINQVPENVVAADVLRRRGYGLVKRPTGGRALLHKGDLCYAIAASRDDHPQFKTLTSTYRTVSQVISSSLIELGVSISRTNSQPVGAKSYLTPCFAMLNPFEVTVGGRKISGSAQFRSGDVFLQHGSLRLLDNWDEGDMSELWPPGQGLDPSKVTSLEAELGLKPATTEVAECFKMAFEKILGVKIEPER